MNTILLGINRTQTYDWYTLYFRDTVRGHKYKVIVYEASGIKDLYMCATIPHMTDKDFDMLENIVITNK